MAKKTFESAFELGEKVLIADHDVTGIVNAIWLERSSEPIQYQVEYVDASRKINDRWFPEREIVSIE